MHIHEAMFSHDPAGDMSVIEQTANSVLSGTRRALGSDFVDIYEQHGASPFAIDSMSKVVFLRMALDEQGNVIDDGEPRYRLAVEALSHGISADDAAAGVRNGGIAPYDSVKLKLLDEASSRSANFSFSLLPDRATKRSRPVFHYATHHFVRGYADLLNLADRAYTIGHYQNTPAAAHSRIGDLALVEQTLRTGRLDKAAAGKLRVRANHENDLQWLSNNPDVLRGSVQHFRDLAEHALSATNFLQEVEQWAKQELED